MLYRKSYPIPMPAEARVIERRGQKTAQWKDRHGREQTAPLAPDGKRIMYVADCWYARYRDAQGVERRISTGCRDQQAATKVLANLLSKVERIKSGLITPAEAMVAAQADKPLAEHLDDYLDHLGAKRIRGRKVSESYRRNIKGRLERLLRDRELKRWQDMTRQIIERWLDGMEEQGLSAATRNDYLTSAIALCNWAVAAGRLSVNPLQGIGKAGTSGDRRHQRRALTVEEVARLLEAAQMRPVAEWGRQVVKRPEKPVRGRKTWTYELITLENLQRCHARGLARKGGAPRHVAQLQKLGNQRRLFYLMAVSTGLRRKELAGLKLRQIHLNAAPTPFVELPGSQTKNGKPACIPLRPEVAVGIGEYLRTCAPPADLDQKLFTKPPAIRVFDADLKAAGIPKHDARGRVVDIHALRHTFGTHLSAVGVHPRVAMAAMRHSRIELTMNLYTDPALLDVAGAINSLPAFGAVRPTTYSAAKTG
jgi:site-specific recombinase XerC